MLVILLVLWLVPITGVALLSGSGFNVLGKFFFFPFDMLLRVSKSDAAASRTSFADCFFSKPAD